MIPHNLLLAKLAAHGVAPESLPLLHSYLKDRSQCVRIEDVILLFFLRVYLRDWF